MIVPAITHTYRKYPRVFGNNPFARHSLSPSAADQRGAIGFRNNEVYTFIRFVRNDMKCTNFYIHLCEHIQINQDLT